MRKKLPARTQADSPARSLAKTRVEICETNWPEDQQELRRLIPERVHPAADRLPLWPRAKLVAAARALQLSGKPLDPVQLLRKTGEIIDGRNTRLVALMAGIEPSIVEIDLPKHMSPDEYVEFRNVVRRQLSPSQLALFASKRYLIMREEGKQRRSRNLRRGSRTPEVEQIPDRGPANSLTLLANLFSVNVKYIQDATAILEHDPELFAKVESGEIPFKEARARMGLVRHRSRVKTLSSAAPAPSITSPSGHRTDEVFAQKGIDHSVTLAKLVDEILQLRSTPKERRGPGLERLFKKAASIQKRLPTS